VDEEAHADEHSLEVQLPFLQVLAPGDVRFAAVAMGLQDEDTARGVGEELARAARGGDVVLVASSDLMHAGPDYRIPVPRGLGVDAFVRAQDEHALRCVAGLDGDKLIDAVRAQDVSMCGAGPVAAVLHAARQLGADEARLLAHATSHDVRPHRSAVGYASFALVQQG
jgi:AmmeMemoRadiSam system protein B